MSALAQNQGPTNIYSSKKVISSGCEHDYPPYCIVTEDGKAEGFSVDLLRACLKEMGYEVSFKTGPWNEIRQDLEDAKIEVLPLVGRTPEREELFDFTIPYLTMHGTIVVRKNENSINSFKDLEGKKVAVMKGDNAEEFLRRSKLDYEIITTTSFAEALKQLSEGKNDAVVIQKLLALQLINKLKITNLKTVARPLEEFKQSFCFAVHKGNGNLLAILNEGLSIVIAKRTFMNLRTKWFASIEATEKNVIIVGGDANAYPYEYLDKNGNPSGCITELTRAIAKEVGMEIEIRLKPWDEIRKAIDNREIDIIQGMYYSIERDRDFDFSLSHHEVNNVIATRKGEQSLKTLDDLFGKSILVMNSDIMHEIAIQKGYEKQLIIVDTEEEALRLLSEGKYDCALVSRFPALFSIKKNKWTNIQLSETSLHHSEYCYAVNHGNEALLFRFTEGLEKLKRNGEYKKIHDKWAGQFLPRTFTFTEILKYLLIVIIPLCLLLTVIFAWSRILRSKVASRTAELKIEIDERKKVMIHLKESEEKFRMLFNGMLNGFGLHEMIFDKDGKPVDYRFIDVNPALERMLELSIEQIIGKTVLEVLPETEKKWIERYGEVVKTGKEILFEEYSAELNKTFEVIAYRPIPGHFATIFRDISDQRKMEEQLRQSEKMQAIGQLAGGIAHDFNNQLASVLGYADLLLLKIDDPELISFAENIKKGAQRSAELTKQLLAFSRKGKYEFVTVDMNKIIGEVVSMLEHTIDKRIRIKQILNVNPALTKGDTTQLYNAILNITLNARDAMKKEGNLILETDIVELDNKSCKIYPYEVIPGQYIKISITDNGTGMDSDTQKRIFEPFFTTKGVGEGTGMGLASVYGTIQNHHGVITVYSEIGKGTTFKISLPLAEELVTSMDDHKVTIKTGNAMILIVDDEELIRNMVADSLRGMGYKVALCKNGKEAFEYYKKSWKKIDLVLLDMIMPEMGGKETFLAMRKINPEVKVLLSSGYSVDCDAQEILDKGAVGFMGKPFTQTELSKKVASALE